MEKKTVIFDFDGVIHSYTSGWQGFGVISDPPVPGIREAIAELRKDYRVVIVSTRCAKKEGMAAMRKWLAAYEIEVDGISLAKPPAVASVDDRAVCFDGDAAGLAEKVRNFAPYWQNKTPQTASEQLKEVPDVKEDLVWYVCYGSNLCKERFLCYLNGTSYKGITKAHTPCSDQTPPRKDRPYTLPYKLYFAKISANWGGGVAFIKEEAGASTPGRAYLVTREQFEEIKQKEGEWYVKSVPLGNLEGYPAFTFTSPEANLSETFPGPAYREVIRRGLAETYPEWVNIVVDNEGNITYE